MLAKLERDGVTIVRPSEAERTTFGETVAPVTAEWGARLEPRLLDYLA